VLLASAEAPVLRRLCIVLGPAMALALAPFATGTLEDQGVDSARAPTCAEGCKSASECPVGDGDL
jgi:hypothetical protein